MGSSWESWLELGRDATVLQEGTVTNTLCALCADILQSETFTPVASAEDARQYSINFDPDVHGTEGPVQVSYPRYIYPQSGMLSLRHCLRHH